MPVINTKQELVNFVADHMRKQKQPSITPGDLCRYRGQNGCKCTLGALIEDKFYNPDMEGCSFDKDPEAVGESIVNSGVSKDVVFAEGVTRKWFMQEVQLFLHDAIADSVNFEDDFEDCLADFCLTQKLEVPDHEVDMSGLSPGELGVLRGIRDRGLAVVVFTVKELNGAEQEKVENRLCELGNEVIESMGVPC